jgi:hypothetical protein
MLLPDCPIFMMLSLAPSLASLETTLLNPQTNAIQEQAKGDIETLGSSWSNTTTTVYNFLDSDEIQIATLTLAYQSIGLDATDTERCN